MSKKPSTSTWWHNNCTSSQCVPGVAILNDSYTNRGWYGRVWTAYEREETITYGLHLQYKFVYLLSLLRELSAVANWHCTRDYNRIRSMELAMTTSRKPGRPDQPRGPTQERSHTTDTYCPSYNNPTHTQHRSTKPAAAILFPHCSRHGGAHVKGSPC